MRTNQQVRDITEGRRKEKGTSVARTQNLEYAVREKEAVGEVDVQGGERIMATSLMCTFWPTLHADEDW